MWRKEISAEAQKRADGEWTQRATNGNEQTSKETFPRVHQLGLHSDTSDGKSKITGFNKTGFYSSLI